MKKLFVKVSGKTVSFIEIFRIIRGLVIENQFLSEFILLLNKLLVNKLPEEKSFGCLTENVRLSDVKTEATIEDYIKVFSKLLF